MIAQDAAKEVVGLERSLLRCSSLAAADAQEAARRYLRRLGEASLSIAPPVPAAIVQCWRENKWRVIQDCLGALLLFGFASALWLMAP